MIAWKNRKIIFVILLAAGGIVLGVFQLNHPDLSAFEHPPTIFKPTIIPKEKEPFKKSVVLINLHKPDSDSFLPSNNFLFNFVPRHLDLRIKEDNYNYPWSMDILPSGDLLIAIHHGTLLRYNSATKQVNQISGLPVDIAHDSYQLGLLDLAVDPDFAKNQQIFMSFTAVRKNSQNIIEYTTCVIGGRLEDKKLLVQKRFCANPWDGNPTQFGGALTFDNDNHILLSIGDRSWRMAAQNIHSTWGKVLRLNKKNLSASISNPFIENRVVWSLGHRNPQGLFYNPANKMLYESEHGPKGGDEINIIRRGLNYGWPVISYGREYENNAAIGEGTAKPGLIQPLYYYTPSIATSALLIYQGNMFPEWKGSIFVTSLAGYHLNHLTLIDNHVTSEERFLGYLQSRLRDIKEAPDGSLYLLSEDGFILRLFR